MHQSLPLVGLPADTYENFGFLFHSLGDKYVRALAEVSKVLPVMIPSMIDAPNLDALLDHFDGVLMTGAVSNVHPPHYGEAATLDHEPYDHARDSTTLKLIRAVIDRVEHQQEEIVLVRNRRQVARLVPEAPHQTALEVFGDLYRRLDDRTAAALAAQVSAAPKRRRGRLSELRNPWAG